MPSRSPGAAVRRKARSIGSKRSSAPCMAARVSNSCEHGCFHSSQMSTKSDADPFNVRISPDDILKFDGFRAQKREILTPKWLPTALRDRLLAAKDAAPVVTRRATAPGEDRIRGAGKSGFPSKKYRAAGEAPFPRC